MNQDVEEHRSERMWRKGNYKASEFDAKQVKHNDVQSILAICRANVFMPVYIIQLYAFTDTILPVG